MSSLNYKGDLFEKIPKDQPGYYNWIGRTSCWLTVIDSYFRVTDGKPKQRYFLCKCKCGNEKMVHGDGIRKERIKSCGCRKPIIDAQKARKMGKANKTHGMFGTRLYQTWNAMLHRCNDVSDNNYGGRGITVDPKWRTFEGFFNDMQEGYRDDLTIDRIDVNGDYTKENCRWVTDEEQNYNKRNTIYIEYRGKKCNLKEWSQETGISISALYQRFNLGLSSEEIFKADRRTQVYLTMDGVSRSIKEWSKLVGISEKNIRSRRENGWDDKSILTTPIRKIKKRR